MELKSILNRKIIDLNIELTTKDEVLKHLSSKLLQEGYITDINQFVQDIYLREEEGITGIGNGIAIPHGKSDSVEKIGIAIGRTNNPIEWESIDDKPVSLIFLFAVSNNTEYSYNHMKILAQIAGNLGNDLKVEKLKKVQTYDELISVFD